MTRRTTTTSPARESDRGALMHPRQSRSYLLENRSTTTTHTIPLLVNWIKPALPSQEEGGYSMTWERREGRGEEKSVCLCVCVPALLHHCGWLALIPRCGGGQHTAIMALINASLLSRHVFLRSFVDWCVSDVVWSSLDP